MHLLGVIVEIALHLLEPDELFLSLISNFEWRKLFLISGFSTPASSQDPSGVSDSTER